MLRWIFPLILLGLQGCRNNSLIETIDYYAFQWSGGTVFSDPNQLTTKEIHFDSGRFLGRDIVLEGEVATTGKYYTYLVLNDTFGRILVVLTHLEDAEEYLRVEKPKTIKVLGSVERGKKGLPYIMARSLSSIKQEKL